MVLNAAYRPGLMRKRVTWLLGAVSDESDVEWEIARGPESGDGPSSQPLQAASSGLLARMRSGLRLSRSGTGTSSPQNQHSQDLSGERLGRSDSGARSGHRRTRDTQSSASPPTTSPLTLVNANELQSALRSVASTMDSLRAAGAAAPDSVPAPTSATAHTPHASPSSGLQTPVSATSVPMGRRRRDRRPPGTVQADRDGLSSAGVPAGTSEPQPDLHSLRRVCS